MHIKHMHEMIEKLAEYGKCMVEIGCGNEEVNVNVVGQIVDMIKDLACAEKDARICKAMEKEEEEDKEEEKYLLNRLKEEYKDEYRQMEERYGEDADRRFYDSWRHADGTFARKGTGSYRPRSSGRRGRRGYIEPPYLHMPYDYRYDVDDYDYADAERNRDLDRMSMNRLYFSEPMSERDGHHDRMHSDRYEEGYRDGEKSGKGKESRYDRARRGYEEAKQQHKGNTPEDKQLTMREMEKVLGVVFDEIDEMLEDASPEMKNMVKTKTMSRMQRIQ